MTDTTITVDLATASADDLLSLAIKLWNLSHEKALTGETSVPCQDCYCGGPACHVCEHGGP